MPRNKITLEQVQKVFTDYKHLSGRKIAEMYGLSHAAINNIRSGRTWKSEMEWLRAMDPETYAVKPQREANAEPIDG